MLNETNFAYDYALLLLLQTEQVNEVKCEVQIIRLSSSYHDPPGQLHDSVFNT